MEYTASEKKVQRKKLYLKDLWPGQCFVVEKDLDNPNPPVYIKLETHASAWSFLCLNTLKEYSAWSKGWAHNKDIVVRIVDIAKINVVFEFKPEEMIHNHSLSVPVSQVQNDHLRSLLTEAVRQLLTIDGVVLSPQLLQWAERQE